MALIVKNEKQALREQYSGLRHALPDSFRHAADAGICRYFTSLASFRYADTVLLFAPSHDEPDIMPIAEEALRLGKSVAFPLCGSAGSMTFRCVRSLDELTVGAFGIRCPSSDAPEADLSPLSHAICAVPAFAFDRSGYRVGYGKGYYDRFLNGYNGSAAGIVYSQFVVRHLPKGKYDMAVNVLVTEKGVRPVYAT